MNPFDMIRKSTEQAVKTHASCVTQGYVGNVTHREQVQQARIMGAAVGVAAGLLLARFIFK